mgnify:FL=1
MGFAWQVYQKTNDHKVAEVLRPIAIFLVGTCHLVMQGWALKSNAAFYLLLFWAASHSFFTLVTNVKKERVAFHYQALIKSWPFDVKSYFLFYLMQGLYAWILALPFYFIAKQTGYSGFDMLVTTGILVSIFLELAADLNRYFFKKNGGTGIYQKSLWKLCRHPNYFFLWLTWLGFSCLGLSDLVSFISVFPCLFLFFIIRLYFIPISEQYLLEKHSEAYRKYQKEVPAFIPYWH